MNIDWRVALAVVVLLAAREVDWDRWRKLAAMYRNGALFEKAQRAA